MKTTPRIEEYDFHSIGNDLANAYNDGRKETAREVYALVDEKCDPEIDIFDGRLYHVGYQAALRDIKKCLEERFGEEIKE